MDLIFIGLILAFAGLTCAFIEACHLLEGKQS